MAIYISEKKTPVVRKSWKFRHLGEGSLEYIYPHYHCAKCDAIIEEGTEYTKKPIKQKGYPGLDYFCSKECAVGLSKQEKKQRKSKYLMWGLIGAYIIIMIVVFLFIL